MTPTPIRGPLLTTVALFAVAAPTLLAYSVSPATTFYNQAIAVVGWGLLLCILVLRLDGTLRSEPAGAARPDAGALAVHMALGVVGVSALASHAWTGFAPALLWSALALLAGAALTLEIARRCDGPASRERVFRAVCWALLAAGLINAVLAAIQIHAPSLADGNWIAAAPGRAAGNLRQANHLSSLMLWSIVAVVWLAQARHLSVRWAVPMALALTYALVLSGSRTGVLGLILLLLWGAIDRRLTRELRLLLVGLPLFYALVWLGFNQLGPSGAAGFADSGRFSTEGDVSSLRFVIWGQALELIARHPWFGVGFGEFNLAWSLTPFTGRPSPFFDHTHNLLLQFAVELGIPLALLLTGLLAFGLWRGWRLAQDDANEGDAMLRRTAWMLVLLIAVHSMLEYPLWYAHFLLPTAFFLGLALSAPASRVATSSTAPARAWLRKALATAAVVMAIGGELAFLDYQQVTPVFDAQEFEVPLAERIAEGQRSWFFSQHADYAAAISSPRPSTVMAAFDSAKHHILDTRLMVAWAKAHAERGDLERARHLAARLREFNNPDSKRFFEPCNATASASDAAEAAAKPRSPLPFQCTAPTRQMDYRDFR